MGLERHSASTNERDGSMQTAEAETKTAPIKPSDCKQRACLDGSRYGEWKEISPRNAQEFDALDEELKAKLRAGQPIYFSRCLNLIQDQIMLIEEPT